MVTRDEFTQVPGTRLYTGRGSSGVTIPPAAGGDEFKPNNTFFVDAAGSLVSFDGVAYTTIQSAMDAANALTPSSTNQYVVRVAPGVYDERFWTLYDFVHVSGMVPAASSVDSSGFGAVRITFGRTVGDGAGSLFSTLANEHITFENLTFAYNGQVTQTSGMDSGARTIKWINCHFQTGTGNTIDFEAWAGDFINCTWYTTELIISGSTALALNFYNNRFGEDSTITNASNSHGYFYGCYFEDTAGAQAVNITSPNVIWEACNYQSLANNNAAAFTFDGTAIGCNFQMSQNPSLASQTVSLIKTAGGASFIGNHFTFTGDDGNTGTEGCFEIIDLTGGQITFTGNHIDRADGHSLAIFMLGSGISADGRIILSGNTIDSRDSGVGAVFAVHSSGFAGNVTVELNGNSYYGEQTSMPTNSGAGRLFWRGSDIKAVFTPASAEWGTGTAGENANFPGIQLDAAAETGFVIGRGNPPSGILIDAALVLSANNSDGIQIDAMTDTDTTNLSAHTPTGGTGTWSAVTGTMTIVSNQVSCSTSSIYTYSIAGKNGYLRANPLAASATGVNQIGVLFRYSNSSNYWRLVEVDEGSNLRLIKRVADVETTVYQTLGTPHFGVTFNGPIIRVYEDVDGTPRLVAEFEDSDLEDNSTVGLFCSRVGGTHTLDDFEWHPGGDVDITVDTDDAHKHFPFASGDEATSDDNGVNVLHHAYSLHDIAFGDNEALSQAKVTLDVLNGNIDQVYVHGLLTRHLPITNHDSLGGDAEEPAYGIFHR